MGARHRALGVRARAAGLPLRVRCHSGQYGPLPLGRERQGRAEHLGPPAVPPGQEPASPSEDLAHERSFLSVARLATPRTTSHQVSITALCIPAGASHPRRRQGKPLWAEHRLRPRPYCDCRKHGHGVGWRRLAFAVPRVSRRLRHGRMGHGRRWLRRPGPSPGSGRRQPPLAFTEYVPTTTVVTLCGTRSVDRNTPPPEALFGQLLHLAQVSRTPGIPAGQCWTSPHESVYMWRHR